MSGESKWALTGDGSSLTRAIDQVRNAVEHANKQWAQMLGVSRDAVKVQGELRGEYVELKGVVEGLLDGEKKYNVTLGDTIKAGKGRIQQLKVKKALVQENKKATDELTSAEEKWVKEQEALKRALQASVQEEAKLFKLEQDMAKADKAGRMIRERQEIEKNRKAWAEYREAIREANAAKNMADRWYTFGNTHYNDRTPKGREFYQGAEQGTSGFLGIRMTDPRNMFGRRGRYDTATDSAYAQAGYGGFSGWMQQLAATQEAARQKWANRVSAGGSGYIGAAGVPGFKAPPPPPPPTSVWSNFWGMFNRDQTTAKQKSEELLLTWQGVARIAAVQVLHKSISNLVAGLSEGIENAKKLGIAIGEIQTIDAGKNSRGNWFNTLKETSDKWGSDMFDQTEAAYESLSNQITRSAGDTKYFLDVVNEFAAVTKSTATDSVDLLSGAINAFGKKITESRQLAAEFYKIIDLGRVRAGEMKDAGDLFVVASQLGVEFEELGAAITTLTRQGTNFDKVSTELSMIMLKLIQPTKEMKKLFSEIGVSSGEAAIATYGFGGLLNILQEKTKGSSTELGKLFSRINSIRGAVGLAGKGLEDYYNDLGQIQNAEASYQAARDIILANSSKKFQIELNKIKNYFLELGTAAIDNLDKATDGFHQLLPIIQTAAKVAFPLFSAAVALATAALAKMAMAGAAALVANPIFLVIGALGILIGELVRVKMTYKSLGQEMSDAFEEGKRAAEESTAKQMEAIDKISKATDNFYKDMLRQQFAKSAAIVSDWALIQDERVEASAKATAAIKRHFDDIKDAHRKTITDIETGIKKLEDSIKKSDERMAESARDAEETIFEHQFDVIDENYDEAISLIDKRMAELNAKVANPPKTPEEADAQNKVYDDLQKLEEKRHSYSLKLGEKRIKEAEKQREKDLQNATKAAQDADKIEEDIQKDKQQRLRRGLRIFPQMYAEQQKKIDDLRAMAGKSKNQEEVKANADALRAEAEQIKKQLEGLDAKADAKKQKVMDAWERVEQNALSNDPFDVQQAAKTERLKHRYHVAYDAIDSGTEKERNALQATYADLMKQVSDLDKVAQGPVEAAKAENAEKLKQIGFEERINALQKRRFEFLKNWKTLAEEQKKKQEEDLAKEKANQQRSEDAFAVYGKMKGSDILKEGDIGVLSKMREEFVNASGFLIEQAKANKQDAYAEELEKEQTRRLETFDTRINTLTDAKIKETATAALEEFKRGRDGLVELYKEYTTKLGVDKAWFDTAKRTVTTAAEHNPVATGLVMGAVKDYENMDPFDDQRFNDMVQKMPGLFEELKTAIRALEMGDPKKILEMSKNWDLRDQDFKSLKTAKGTLLTERGAEVAETFKNQLAGLVKYAESLQAGVNTSIPETRVLLVKTEMELARLAKAQPKFTKATDVAAVSIQQLGDASAEAAFKMANIPESPLKPLWLNPGEYNNVDFAGDAVPRAFGGFIPSGSDTVPAMLSPGEFVVNAAAARQFYSQLVQMNSSVRPRHYAGGGSVDVGGISINIHAAQGHDPQAVAKAVTREINRGLRQKTIRLGR